MSIYSNSPPDANSSDRREKLPNRRGGEVFEFEYRTAKYTATISYYPGTDRIAEIFLDHAKPNSQLAELANTAAILASLLLQHGCTVAEIRHSISGPLAMALALVEEPTP